MQEAADIELLRQYAQTGSEEAFATLVARHIDLVYSVALRKTGNPHAAQDIAQAVFVILARKAAGFRERSVLIGWLYQTTRLTAGNFLRTEIRRFHREQEAYMQASSHESGPEIWTEISPHLEDAMARLSESDRNALLLRFFEGKSFHEIGTSLGASENAAKKRVDYALEKLRKFFSKHGVKSTVVLIAGAISAHSVQAAPAGLAQTATAVAITKGATAGSSTLTLIKGALKIMAWTKAKTTIIIGLGVVLGATGIGISIQRIQANAAVDRVIALMNTWNARHPSFRVRSTEVSTDGITMENTYLMHDGQWKDQTAIKDEGFRSVLFSAGTRDYLEYFPLTQITVGKYFDKDLQDLCNLMDWRTVLSRKMADERGFTITLITNTPPFCIRIQKNWDPGLKEDCVIDAEGKLLVDISVSHDYSSVETYTDWSFDEPKIADEFARIQVKTNIDTTNYTLAYSNEMARATQAQK